MKTKIYLVVSSAVFAVIAVAHLLRLVLGWSAQLGTWTVPLWVSIPVVLVSAGVAVWGLSLARRA